MLKINFGGLNISNSQSSTFTFMYHVVWYILRTYGSVCVCVLIAFLCIYISKTLSVGESWWQFFPRLSRAHHSCASRSHKGVEREFLQALLGWRGCLSRDDREKREGKGVSPYWRFEPKYFQLVARHVFTWATKEAQILWLLLQPM